MGRKLSKKKSAGLNGGDRLAESVAATMIAIMKIGRRQVTRVVIIKSFNESNTKARHRMFLFVFMGWSSFNASFALRSAISI